MEFQRERIAIRCHQIKLNHRFRYNILSLSISFFIPISFFSIFHNIHLFSFSVQVLYSQTSDDFHTLHSLTCSFMIHFLFSFSLSFLFLNADIGSRADTQYNSQSDSFQSKFSFTKSVATFIGKLFMQCN